MEDRRSAAPETDQVDIVLGLVEAEEDEAAGRIVDGKALVARLRQRADDLQQVLARRKA